MKEKHGVTAIIFDEEKGARYFLLLHRVLNWSGWEFCKGGIDKGEESEQAVVREIKEETSLSNIVVVSKLAEKVTWTAKGIKFIYTPFLIRASMDDKISLVQEIIEHDNYKWLEEREVEGMLTHKDTKKVFREAVANLNLMKK